MDDNDYISRVAQVRGLTRMFDRGLVVHRAGDQVRCMNLKI